MNNPGSCAVQNDDWVADVFAMQLEYNGANLEVIYFSEGRLTPNDTLFYYEYTVKDHLGNARYSTPVTVLVARKIQAKRYERLWTSAQYVCERLREATLSAAPTLRRDDQFTGKCPISPTFPIFASLQNPYRVIGV